MSRVVALFIVLLASVGARADVVFLKDGSFFPGTIQRESAAEVVILSENVNWTFRKENIASIRREAPARSSELKPVRAANAVVLYGTAWCGYCQMARKYFVSKGIPFTDRDVERDPGAARELADLKRRAGIRGNGVPVIDVGGRVLLGFDQRSVEAALAANGR